MKGIPNKHTSLSSRDKFGLIRTKTMDISNTPKHTKRNLWNETSTGVGLLKSFQGSLKVEDTRRHSID